MSLNVISLSGFSCIDACMKTQSQYMTQKNLLLGFFKSQTTGLADEIFSRPDWFGIMYQSIVCCNLKSRQSFLRQMKMSALLFSADLPRFGNNLLRSIKVLENGWEIVRLVMKLLSGKMKAVYHAFHNLTANFDYQLHLSFPSAGLYEVLAPDKTQINSLFIQEYSNFDNLCRFKAGLPLAAGCKFLSRSIPSATFKLTHSQDFYD